MRKLLKRFAVPLLCVLTSMILTGCFEDEITFKGKVLGNCQI